MTILDSQGAIPVTIHNAKWQVFFSDDSTWLGLPRFIARPENCLLGYYHWARDMDPAGKFRVDAAVK